MAKQNTPEKYRLWIEARKRFRLSDAHIQMARELGLNPKKLNGLANTKQEPWKLPLPQFIEKLYFKRFKKERPDTVRSIEDVVKHRKQKKEASKLRNAQREAQAASGAAIDQPAPADGAGARPAG